LYLNFYGVLVKVISNDQECISFIRSDFSYFLSSSEEMMREPEITVSVFLCKPPFDRIPKGTIAAYHTKDSIVYKEGDVHYFDSSGKGMVIFDHKNKLAEIYNLQRDFLYEKSYLMIMSRVGEILDKKKLHRIHSMGVVYKGKAILCLLPMGGGKTTLTLSLLANKEFSLLSEEVPLVSNKGFLHPFPIRMGVTEGTRLSIPGEFLKSFNRTHYEPKTLIDVEFFNEQISGVAEPGFLFIGKRVYSENPEIIKISKLKAFPSLFRLCVMGIGIPQLMEYILRFDFLDMARQFPIIFSRLWASVLLLKRSKTYELRLGYDKAGNAEYLTKFFKPH
jgi:hypothetical protein